MNPAADKVIDLYRRHAKAWTSARGQRLLEKVWLDRFQDLLPAPTQILDIGCGSGVPIAHYLVQSGHAVTGVDGSPEMIAQFQRNLPDQTAWIADMRTMQLGQRFGGLMAWNSFFHLTHDHQRGMFPLFAEHAEAGAPLLFTSGPANGEAMGSLEGDPLYHASLDEAEYRHLLEQNGFRVVAHVQEDPNCGGLTVWLAQHG